MALSLARLRAAKPIDIEELRAIVRKDTGEDYKTYLKRLAQEAGIENPTDEQLRRFDRKRKKKTSNEDWKSATDADSLVAHNERLACGDQNNDGMPDTWERANGSNPNADDAMMKAADGYALIEHYVNWLAGPHATSTAGAA